MMPRGTQILRFTQFPASQKVLHEILASGFQLPQSCPSEISSAGRALFLLGQDVTAPRMGA